MINRLADYLRDIIYKGICLLVDDLNLKIPGKIVLNEQIRIVTPKSREYGDLSSNIIIKLERWLKSVSDTNDSESKNDKLNTDFLSDRLIQILDTLLTKDPDQKGCSVYLFEGDIYSGSMNIKFKIENRSRGFINFHIISDKANKKIEDFIIKKDGSEFFPVRTIGYCYSCWTEKFGIPRQSVLVPSSRGMIQLLPEFNSDFIYGLSEFSHLWVIFIFSNVPENTLMNPMVRPPRLNGKPTGVYSTRSPHRTNRIGISIVKIDSISRNRIYISGVDLLNCTPIIDIKPYHICDVVDKEELMCPKWISNSIECEFEVIIPDKILDKLKRITDKTDLLSEESIRIHEKKLNRLRTFGGEWPFIFFKSHVEFFETITQSLSFDVRCRQRKENEYGGVYQIRLDAFEIHYKINEESKTVELTDLDLILM